MYHLVKGIQTSISLQATGMMDLSEYKNAEAWEAKMIKLIPNYEKVNHQLSWISWFVSKGEGKWVH